MKVHKRHGIQMKRLMRSGIMKKRAVLFALCLLLAGCGNTAQTTAEMDSETETTVINSEEVNAVDESAEQMTLEALTEEAEDENVLETGKEAKAEAKTTEESTESDETMIELETEVESEVLKDVTEKITVFDTPKTMYATIALNVRRGPSTQYEVVSYLAMAQAVEVTGQAETGWYQLKVDGVPAYASNAYLSEVKVEIPVAAPVQPEASLAATQPATVSTPTATVAPAGVIMVGDSRCVQMQAAVGGGGCSWICENSKEYTWFSETAIPRFDPYVGKGTKVVINMGVNDPEHYNQYIELVNAKAAEWAQRGAKTYFVSVNPVWENPYTDQEDVDTFNTNVPGRLVGVTWIDTSSWLNSNGYRLLDGLHYDDPTYVNIFNLIMGSL